MPDVINQLNQAINQLPQVSGNHGEIHVSKDLIRLLNMAEKLAHQRGDRFISSELIVLAATEDNSQLQRILRDCGVRTSVLSQAIDEIRGGETVDTANAEEQRASLEKFTIDLTERAEQGKIDPVIGRDDEIRRTIQVLQKAYQE